MGDTIFRTNVLSYLDKWRDLSYLSEYDLSRLQISNLKKLLHYSVSNIPYYKFSQIKKSHDVYEWLCAFPPMHKEDIKNHINDLIFKPKSKLIKYSSSGSSGVQGTVYMNKKEQSIIRAIMLLWWEWAGYTFDKTTIQTGITPERGFIKNLKDLVLDVEYVSAFRISEKEILDLLFKYRNKKNLFLAGYPSSLNVFAEIALKNNLDNIKIDGAVCWGDKLFDHYKTNINEAFGCSVKETYSCNEGFLVGAKKDLEYFYIMSPHVQVEIVDKDFNPVPDGTLGYVLLTRLDCFSMPLIRYYVGDLAVKLPREKYPEKREMYFPLLERVIGRDTDIVITPSGKKLIVHFFTGIFEFIPEIRQFMVIQREINGIEIHYIPGSGFNGSILEKLEKIFFDKIQEHLNINWKEVDIIPPTASGKPQLIQSFIGRS
jgi:phenylacetate-CoA ligase